ncbi:hypothetical protein [Marilutibacter chinensis]|uniref:Antibiotic biosynthesis monooxygenase n=1 Tax=Marilutibacter chinensis TaxID=2912247 RepID=A0ABS9HRW8_9GAMM|nr:hypothetical protein [Lysobacter chinensis]MCF7220880.1 hypothetical protein [Lysobacter chinensis]
MALLEDRTAAFIVRVWSERSDRETVAAEWRGSVEHVQSGQRVFFRHLETVVEFMKPHLEGIGIDAQQRFWERVSTVINGADDQPVSLTLEPRAPGPALDVEVLPIPARKRR